MKLGDGATAGAELASDLSSLEAGGADILTLGVAIYQGADTPDIRIPSATGSAI